MIRQKSELLLSIDEYYSLPTTRLFECETTSCLTKFDTSSLNGIERLKIGGDCYMKANRFVIDGFNVLKSIFVGKNSFHLKTFNRYRSRCVIMNCDQLSEIHFGESSFSCYESFELKNLPSLMSIQLDEYALCSCHKIVFDSMND